MSSDRGPSRHLAGPYEEGYFKMREYPAGRGGPGKPYFAPWVPARIYRPKAVDPSTGEEIDRWCRLTAEVNGVSVEIETVWMYGREITEAEWRRLIMATAVRESQ